MKKIFKYPFVVDDVVELKMPKGAQLLSIQFQDEQLCAWALVDPDENLETRKLRIIGTGHPVFDDDLEDTEFFTTVQVVFQEQNLVWHIFIYKEN